MNNVTHRAGERTVSKQLREAVMISSHSWSALSYAGIHITFIQFCFIWLLRKHSNMSGLGATDSSAVDHTPPSVCEIQFSAAEHHKNCIAAACIDCRVPKGITLRFLVL
jgi:hypothetical protein